MRKSTVRPTDWIIFLLMNITDTITDSSLSASFTEKARAEGKLMANRNIPDND